MSNLRTSEWIFTKFCIWQKFVLIFFVFTVMLLDHILIFKENIFNDCSKCMVISFQINKYALYFKAEYKKNIYYFSFFQLISKTHIFFFFIFSSSAPLMKKICNFFLSWLTNTYYFCDKNLFTETLKISSISEWKWQIIIIFLPLVLNFQCNLCAINVASLTQVNICMHTQSSSMIYKLLFINLFCSLFSFISLRILANIL